MLALLLTSLTLAGMILLCKEPYKDSWISIVEQTTNKNLFF